MLNYMSKLIAFCLKNRYKGDMKTCPFVRMSDLRVGDKFQFTLLSSIIYQSFHPGSQVGGFNFILMQVMCLKQYTFYSYDEMTVRHALSGHCDYRVVLLERGGS